MTPETPSPGTLAARVDGCTCPPQPTPIDDGPRTWITAAGCPLHDRSYAHPAGEGDERSRTPAS